MVPHASFGHILRALVDNIKDIGVSRSSWCTSSTCGTAVRTWYRSWSHASFRHNLNLRTRGTLVDNINDIAVSRSSCCSTCRAAAPGTGL